MEIIFECFFEQTFNKLERSGLKSRQTRRDVLDHLNAIISGCCDGQNMTKDEVSCLAVQAAIKYHRQMRSGNNQICLMGKYHNILYIGVKTAWDWGLSDSWTIKELLGNVNVNFLVTVTDIQRDNDSDVELGGDIDIEFSDDIDV